MPSITVIKSDLEQLLGATVDLERFDQELETAKAEVKGYDRETDELKIELNDTNRPDLWSTQGLARQLRARREGHGREYPFFAAERTAVEHRIIVDPALREIRPYVAGFLATGSPLDSAGLRALIQSQEKLAENYGRKRSAVAIGAYRIELIRFPIHYRAAEPATTRFTPLEFAVELSLSDILDQHPKGQEYGHLIRHFDRFPLLADDRGEVLSMPPVINSNNLGHVVEGDADLFVEVTGHDLRQLILAINIAAVDLADRGATIYPVVVEYPYDTPFGRQVITPCDLGETVTVSLADVRRLLGESLAAEEARDLLVAMGHRAVRIDEQDGTALHVSPPPYRDDLLHPVDVIEDIAIGRNLNTFEPILPEEFTVGRLSDEEEAIRVIREHLIGAGFQEVVSTILTSREALYERMRRPDDGRCIEIDNVMSANFAVLRDTALPSLLGVEAVSAKATYPHRTFEIGEVVERAPGATLRCRTRVVVSALLSHPKATVSELQSFLEALCFYMVRDYELVPIEHPSFMEGRVGILRIAGRDAGLIGEIHPECLERWGVNVPVSAFEVDLDALR